MDNETELVTLADRMRDLAERLMRVPVMFGVDQGDVDQLIEAAAEIERLEKLAKAAGPQIRIEWETVDDFQDDAYTGPYLVGTIRRFISVEGPEIWGVYLHEDKKARAWLSKPEARAAVEKAAVEALTKGAENG